MNDFSGEGDLESVADDTADVVADEDQEIDNPEGDDAALAADDEGEVEGQPEAEEEPGATMIKLPSGEEISLTEIEAGAFRQADYTRKTMELAKEREQAEALKTDFQAKTQLFQQTFQKLGAFAESLLPPMPPVSLAQTDPNEYTRQRVLREAAEAEIGSLFSVNAEASSQINAATQEELQKYRAAEDAKLVKAIPALKDPAYRAKFDADVKKTALDFGFSEAEVTQTSDHRVRSLVHYARIGKLAEENRKNAARRVEPPRKGAVTASAAPTDSQARASRHFAKNPTIANALKLDF